MFKLFSRDSFLSEAGYAFAIRVTGASLGFSVQVLMARNLGVSEYGYYVYALSWVFTISIFSNLGQHLPIIKYFAQYGRDNQPELILGLTRWAHGAVLSASVLLGMFYVAGVSLFQREEFAIDISVIVLSVLLLPALGIIQTNKSIMFASQKSALGMIPDNVIKNIAIIFLLAGTYIYYGKQMRALEAMAIVVMSVYISAISSFLILYYSNKAKRLKTKNRKPKYNAKEWFHTGLPFLFVAAAETVVSRVDILILGMFVSPAEVGIYASASLLVAAINMIPQAIESVTGPRFANFLAKEKIEEAQEFLTRVVRALASIVFIMSVLVIFFGENLLGAFGKDFTAGELIVFVLVLEPLVQVSVGSVGQLLGLSGNQDIYAKSGIVVGMLNICISLILIPQYGAIGAAISRVISAILASLSMGYFVWRRIGIMPGLAGRRLIEASDRSDNL